MREYEATKDLVATHVAGLLPGLDLAGQWSLDVMRDGDDYWLIDMAARRVRPVAGRALGRSGRKETVPV